MMYKLLLCALLLFSVTSGNSQAPKSSRKSPISFNNEPAIENPVSTIKTLNIRREVIFWIDPKRPKKDSAGVSVKFYDSTGHLVEQQNYDDNNLRSKQLYNYYTDYSLYRIVDVNFQLNTTNTTILEYDSLNNEVKKYYFNADTTNLTIEQKEYNSQNQLIRVFRKFNANELYLHKKLEYDAQNRLTRTTSLDENGVEMYVDLIEYGPQKETEFLQNQSGKSQRLQRIFNDKNQLIRKIIPAHDRVLTGLNGYIAFDNEDAIQNYIYNPDGTILEWNSTYKDKKQVYRHYYYRE